MSEKRSSFSSHGCLAAVQPNKMLRQSRENLPANSVRTGLHQTQPLPARASGERVLRAYTNWFCLLSLFSSTATHITGRSAHLAWFFNTPGEIYSPFLLICCCPAEAKSVCVANHSECNRAIRTDKIIAAEQRSSAMWLLCRKRRECGTNCLLGKGRKDRTLSFLFEKLLNIFGADFFKTIMKSSIL
jgi:hypothetical protein